MRWLASVLLAVAWAASGPAQMVSGSAMPGYAKAFGLSPSERSRQLNVQPIGSNHLTNVVWPGETIQLRLLVENRTDAKLALVGQVRSVGYRTAVARGDIWVPQVSKVSETLGEKLSISLKPRQSQIISIRPPISTRFGCYGVVLDFGNGGRAWAGTVARVVKPSLGREFRPSYAIDMPWPFEISPAVSRTFYKLGVKGCRMSASYTPTTSPDFESSLRELAQHLEWARKDNITVMLTIGAGSARMPLGRGRPWLKPDDTLIEGVKEDLAWLPDQDPDFRKYVRILCERFGWPRGPVNAVELWNEPWEGVSISGWGADLLRYREIYKQMGLGVMDARTKGAKVLIGGTSSSSNTLDKLFPDDSKEFLPMLDFVSIHYQGPGAIPSLVPMWVDRKGPYGPVQNWDTESWVANSEDRVPAVVASMFSFGQQRAMGTYGGNTYEAFSVDYQGKNYRGVQAWSLAPAVAAAAHYIGPRPFKELVFGRGLPWVYRFGASNSDDGTLVVLGEMGLIYSEEDQWFRPSQAAVARKDGRLIIRSEPSFRLIDANGNRINPQGGNLVVPINSLGYYLRTDGRMGSFARLLRAVRSARIEGYPPCDIVAHDLLAPVGEKATLRLTLTNLLNRPIRGSLRVKLSGATLSGGQAITLAPHSVQTVSLPVTGVRERADNLYPVQATFTAGADGTATHREALRVNLIARRTITVDGNLDDWKGVRPQNLTGEGIRASMTEQAWLPFKDLARNGGESLTTGYVAYDQRGFYFGARSIDPTPSPGTIRFAKRDDDSYFYPAVSYESGTTNRGFAVRWQGTVSVATAGNYTFYTLSDDGVRLKVDGKLLIDNWSDHGPIWNNGVIRLEANQPTPITLEYYQGGGGAEIRLEWEIPDGKRATIPTSALRSSDGKPGLSATYFGDRELKNPLGQTVSPEINFSLGDRFPEPGMMAKGDRRELKWPEGVRRFSYRKDPDLPSGNGTDNIQIAFNVVPLTKEAWRSHPAGTFPRYMAYPCTDYEYALNTVSPEHGGGTEIWRLLAPGVPRKHFYPRQPKAKMDGGPVTPGQLAVVRQGPRRITEAFLPWSEIPDVRRALAEGRTIRFSFRVNDNNGPAYELAQDRSVSKRNFLAFHNDWATHWANEVEFAFERPRAKR